ncbi:MAG: non-hydrolyzing UDP-N-acetylglucosamine 2-epimerase [Candidatus Rokuibacteriota bacterium]
MKVVTVVGARPQFIKAAPLSRRLRERHREVLVHTGQHYDDDMSALFFEELSIPSPDYHLGIGSGPHGAQTGAMLEALETVLLKERPEAVIVYGDTNSTLAGALAAAKLQMPIAHVEAGLRSFNRAMPEEINRVVTDHLSTWLFVPSDGARRQLEREGITEGVHVVGDIMADTLRVYGARSRDRTSILDQLRLQPGAYYLATVHRAENTDAAEALRSILEAFSRLDRVVVLPLHPRTRQRLAEHGLRVPDNVCLVPPAGYLDMLALEASAACVLTDSGGVQKEAYCLGVPCVTLRSETEWVETVEAGWNVIAGIDPERIVAAVRAMAGRRGARPELYGDGATAERIVTILSAHAVDHLRNVGGGSGGGYPPGGWARRAPPQLD